MADGKNKRGGKSNEREIQKYQRKEGKKRKGTMEEDKKNKNKNQEKKKN